LVTYIIVSSAANTASTTAMTMFRRRYVIASSFRFS